MKRYRILSFDFDSRADSLEPTPESASLEDREMYDTNRQSVIDDLVEDYGIHNSENKISNFKNLGKLPCSFYAFHNRFVREIRDSYIIGSYYPALVGACALGERLLNHLVLLLRAEFSNTPVYKKIYRKNSFDNWDTVLDALDAWGILQSDVKAKFHELKSLRNMSIHFNYDTEKYVERDALNGIKLIQDIVSKQFSFSTLNDTIFINQGEIYIKSESLKTPYIRLIVIPISSLVGASHEVSFIGNRIAVHDPQEYENTEITDEEFIVRRNEYFMDKRATMNS